MEIQPQQLNNRFAPKDVAIGVVEKEEVYNDGFSFSEREAIKKAFKELDRRDKEVTPLTIEEQIIIIKHFRIARTEAFILNAPKTKAAKVAKEPKAPKAPKVSKVKKLTKKDQSRLEAIAFLMKEEILTIDTMPEEDRLFWETNKFRLEEETNG